MIGPLLTCLLTCSKMAQRLTALVTGGASGLGRATALQLARRGMGVVVADLRNNTPFQDENIRFAETDVSPFSYQTKSM